MRRLLFLDMDGVLNSHWAIVEKKCFDHEGDMVVRDGDADVDSMLKMVDHRAANLLGFIQARVPGLEIVISSTWRKLYTLDQFRAMFTALGLGHLNVVGSTTSAHLKGQKFSERVPRIAQIEDYRASAGVPWADCVIFDDHDISDGMVYEGEHTATHWVPADEEWRNAFLKTDNFNGLTYKEAVVAVVRLVGWDGANIPVIMM